MGIKRTALGIFLLSVLGISNNALCQDTIRMKSGAEIGRIINKNNNGFKAGIYFYNPRVQIGYVIEHDKKPDPSSLGKGIDLLKCGIEADCFPTNMKVLKPYIGSELKYEGESYFVGEENVYYKKRGIGLEMKCGTEFKPLNNREIRLFLDFGYNLAFDKKSKGYPKNPEVKRDKFIGTVGLKFSSLHK